MNAYLEQACGLFGAASCETANTIQYLTMAFTALAIAIVLWLLIAVANR